MREKRRLTWILRGAVALLFLLISLVVVHRSEWRSDVRVIIEIESPARGVYSLVVDGDRVAGRLDGKGVRRRVVFELPRRVVEQIRFYPGAGPGEVRVSRIGVRTVLAGHSWRGGIIRKLFSHRSGVGLPRTEGGNCVIPCTTGEPSLVFGFSLANTINKVGGRKHIFYLLAVIASLFIFYMPQAVDPRGLKFFLDLKIMGNMVFPFLLLISFPLLNSVLHVLTPLPITERRVPAPKPELRLDAVHRSLTRYTRYVNDHFITRNVFIHLHNRLMYGLFRLSTVPMVVAGREGWLFMGRETPRRDEMAYFRAVDPFSPDELARWAEILETRRRWLARRGILYLFVVVPNKSTIYPEFLPAFIHSPVGPSRLDQLLEYLGDHTEVEALDLRPGLMRAKLKFPVYYKTDSHWNEFGAYTAYLEIMNHLGRFNPRARPMPFSRFRLAPVDRVGGDLAAALTLEKEVLREEALHMEAVTPLTARTVDREDLNPFVTRSIAVSPGGDLPTALMVQDSFIHELRPFLAEHFSRMVFIWDWDLNIYPRIIEEERPWIVIDEMAERYLADQVLSNPEAVSAGPHN